MPNPLSYLTPALQVLAENVSILPVTGTAEHQMDNLIPIHQYQPFILSMPMIWKARRTSWIYFSATWLILVAR